MTSEPGQPKLLDRVREAIRVRHYSRRTEEAYAHWIRRYIVSHRKAHPATLAPDAISKFLTWQAALGLGLANRPLHLTAPGRARARPSRAVLSLTRACRR